MQVCENIQRVIKLQENEVKVTFDKINASNLVTESRLNELSALHVKIAKCDQNLEAHQFTSE